MFNRILAAVGAQSSSIEAAANAVSKRLGDSSVDVFHVDSVARGEVLDELLHHVLETEADLLVLGAHRHVIASRAAMLAPASVLMVPEGASLKFDRILVPVDFSESSIHALRCAARFDPGFLFALAVECDDEPWLDWKEDEGRFHKHLSQLVAQTGIDEIVCMVEPLVRGANMLQHDGLSPARRIEGADIAATIVSASERTNASLIVMGTRGRTASASVLLGSVTEHVLQQSRRPVLALKEPGSPLNLLQAVLSRLREPAPAVTAN